MQNDSQHSTSHTANIKWQNINAVLNMFDVTVASYHKPVAAINVYFALKKKKHS